MTEWTIERSEELKQRWAGTESATVIAAAMGMTRNAILGRVYRMDLPARGSRKLSEEAREVSRKNRNRSRAARAQDERQKTMEADVQLSRAVSIVPKKQYVQPVQHWTGEPLNIPLADLRRYSGKSPNQCRYIASEPPGPDYICCGIETEAGRSYCAHHHTITHDYRREASPSIQPARRAA